MKFFELPIIFILLLILISCKNAEIKRKENNKEKQEAYNRGSFGYDLDFLKTKDSNLIVLISDDSSAQIIVSAKYQAKVFTSTSGGRKGNSFGWINYKAFDEPVNDHMNAYGGEDRLWLGPEGGKFSLFFKPGSKMVFDNWHTPAFIDTENWQTTQADNTSMSMTKDADLQNYTGAHLKMKVNRDVEILSKAGIEQSLNIMVSDAIQSVGFKTTNAITNNGDMAWTEKTGIPCLWNLDMFTPSPECVIVIPYKKEAKGKVATTDYFGEIPDDRITVKDGILYFKADGKSRGKLGIPPERVKNRAGSYDALNNVLTIIQYDIDPDSKYLNQEWNTDKPIFSGDAMNAYNDGPLEDGKQMGPFYELESVSRAAFLQPGEKLTHYHSVYHFTGDKIGVDEIAQKLLGVSLEQIQSVFKK